MKLLKMKLKTVYSSIMKRKKLLDSPRKTCKNTGKSITIEIKLWSFKVSLHNIAFKFKKKSIHYLNGTYLLSRLKKFFFLSFDLR